jgi:hypothetical protein
LNNISLRGGIKSEKRREVGRVTLFSYYSPATVPAFPTIKDLPFLKHA